MEGSIYLKSNGNAAEAELDLTVEYDFTNEDYECALIEITLPYTQVLSVPSSQIGMLWFASNQFKSKDKFRKATFENFTSDHVFALEMFETLLEPFQLESGLDVCKYISDYLKLRLGSSGEAPILKYKRGYVSISLGVREDAYGNFAIGLPYMTPLLRRALGLREDDSDIKNFLKTNSRTSEYTAPDVANISLNVFFNEVQFNAVESIVPRNKDVKILRVFPNIPATPRSVHFLFDPPIWCPVEKNKYKKFIVNIKDNEGNDVSFKRGESIFQICFRKKNG